MSEKVYARILFLLNCPGKKKMMRWNICSISIFKFFVEIILSKLFQLYNFQLRYGIFQRQTGRSVGKVIANFLFRLNCCKMERRVKNIYRRCSIIILNLLFNVKFYWNSLVRIIFKPCWNIFLTPVKRSVKRVIANSLSL